MTVTVIDFLEVADSDEDYSVGGMASRRALLFQFESSVKRPAVGYLGEFIHQ
ncbi:MAG: hypothetical protein ACI8PT_001128 [Gammaproteobacteria bacterium]|jgi:hypothetical protein